MRKDSGGDGQGWNALDAPKFSYWLSHANVQGGQRTLMHGILVEAMQNPSGGLGCVSSRIGEPILVSHLTRVGMCTLWCEVRVHMFLGFAMLQFWDTMIYYSITRTWFRGRSRECFEEQACLNLRSTPQITRKRTVHQCFGVRTRAANINMA